MCVRVCACDRRVFDRYVAVSKPLCVWVSVCFRVLVWERMCVCLFVIFSMCAYVCRCEYDILPVILI